MGDDDTSTLQTPIERMYRAGKEHIPAQAESLGTMASWLRSGMDTVDTQAALMGDPAVMRDMLGVSDLVFEALRRGAVSLNHCAVAMIATADDYVATDDQAKTDFTALDQDLKDQEIDEAYVPDAQAPTKDEGATVTEYDERGRSHVHETDSTPDPGAEPADDLADRDEGIEDEDPDLPEVP